MSERGSTKNINKNTCKKEPSDNKDTGLNKKNLQMFPDCSDEVEKSIDSVERQLKRDC